MKSLVLNAPNDLRLEERPAPVPGPTDVVIRVASSAICHTDFVSIAGEQREVRFPTVIGHEFSGIVESCGVGVTHVSPGDRVCALGYSYCGKCSPCRKGYHIGCRNLKGIPANMEGADQEFVSVPDMAVYPIADSLSLEQAALVEPAANGCSCVDTADIRLGENVAVIGPGPMGLLALQFAALKSPKSLIVLGTREERLSMAVKLGATHAINVRGCDPVKEIMDITDGNGVEAVLYCAGNEEAWELAGNILGFRGRLAIEAVPDLYDSRWTVQPARFNDKVLSYTGVNGYSSAQFETALRLVESGKIDVASLITHRFPLDDYQEAFETSSKRKGGAIKVVFEIHQEKDLTCSKL